MNNNILIWLIFLSVIMIADIGTNSTNNTTTNITPIEIENITTPNVNVTTNYLPTENVAVVTDTEITANPTVTKDKIRTETKYKIGEKTIEVVSSFGNDTASIEPKIMTAQNGELITSSEASYSNSKIIDELKDQPILEIKSEILADKQNRKIILKLEIENIGDVKAKNIRAISNPKTDAKVLYTKEGKVSEEGAIWTGEIDAKKSQELVYEFNYQGDAKEDLKIPLTITGHGSNEWILDILWIIGIDWLRAHGFEIPDIPRPNPGFDILMGTSTILIVLYLAKKRFKR